jgi:hypothetical protein
MIHSFVLVAVELLLRGSTYSDGSVVELLTLLEIFTFLF